MPLMQWSEKMSVGVPELDADHKELIRIINQLAADVYNSSRRSAVRQSLLALLRYTGFHFAREEKVMVACGFPDLEEHKRTHRGFVARIRALKHRFDEDPEGSTEIVDEDLLLFLQNWLSHHILIEDKSYRASVEACPEARQAAKSFKATEVRWSG